MFFDPFRWVSFARLTTRPVERWVVVSMLRSRCWIADLLLETSRQASTCSVNRFFRKTCVKASCFRAGTAKNIFRQTFPSVCCGRTLQIFMSKCNRARGLRNWDTWIESRLDHRKFYQTALNRLLQLSLGGVWKILHVRATPIWWAKRC